MESVREEEKEEYKQLQRGDIMRERGREGEKKRIRRKKVMENERKHQGELQREDIEREGQGVRKRIKKEVCNEKQYCREKEGTSRQKEI